MLVRLWRRIYDTVSYNWRRGGSDFEDLGMVPNRVLLVTVHPAHPNCDFGGSEPL
jgi:hypothetical protein